MSVLQATPMTVGAVGVSPREWRILTDDTFAAVTTAGYLTSLQASYGFSDGDFAFVTTSNLGVVMLNITVSAAGVVSLVDNADAQVITYPVTANHIAVFTATSSSSSTLGDDATIAINGGSLQAGLSGTAGYLASFPATAAKGSLRLTAVANTGDTLVTISNAAHGQASVYSIPDSGTPTANFIISSKSGGQTITTGGLTISAGSLAASTGSVVSGSNGGAINGSFIAYPPTASRGTFNLIAANNTADYSVTITNAAHGQSSSYSIPDVGEATGQITVVTGALVSGNLMAASGTAGKLADGGFNIKSAITAAYGGGGTSNAFTATGLTTSSIVTAVIVTSTNAVSICKAVPTANTLTITFSADPGASTTVAWIATSVAVA